MFEPPDQQQRQRALDPLKSFIVQAPAGSGKTALLVQRYLILLAQVHEPEEVVALTFTRKAATEMRLRIVNTLQTTYENKLSNHVMDSHAHRDLAKQLLQHQSKKGWNLLAHPHRFRIQTIDAFNAHLVESLPILSGLGTGITVSELPKQLYRLSIQSFFNQITQTATIFQSVRKLLLHLGNDYNRLEVLLMEMLACRDQWLPHLPQPSRSHLNKLRISLEQALERIRLDLLNQLNTLPTDLQEHLLELINFTRQQKSQTLIKQTGNEIFWSHCLDLLLTEKNKWRKTVTAKQGFPATSTIKNPKIKSLATSMKHSAKELLKKLSASEHWRQRFIAFRIAPPKIYTENQWDVLKALFELLPILVKKLQNTFQVTKTLDYTEVSLRALQAIQMNPVWEKDKRLSIRHLLIDEFQDTSFAQFRLLKVLTKNWKMGDSRSLFLVGDPMQSIYRFRKAEVSLFQHVQKYGIGKIQLDSLILTANFRSSNNLVIWINDSFSKIINKNQSIRSNESSFTSSIAQFTNPGKSAIHWHWIRENYAVEEAKIISELVKNELDQYPKNRIAILVRARTHLPWILETLRLNKIAYHAVEVDYLAQRRYIQDALALTRALLHPADDIAWLAILRAPWIGLTLSDLHKLLSPLHSYTHPAHFPSITVWKQLSLVNELNLHHDARKRIQRVLPILKQAVQNQGRESLMQRVRKTWFGLGGPALLQNPNDYTDIQTFFELLDRMQVGEDITDLVQLENELNHLHAAPMETTLNTLEVMTIHKAKGLEFDTVILAGLYQQVSKDGTKLLFFKEQHTEAWSNLILAPIKAKHEKQDPIYAYLAHEEKQAAEQETIRLLYVASTRARLNLHLIGCLKQVVEDFHKKPPPDSFLRILWPILPLIPTEISSSVQQSLPPITEPPLNILKRLPLDWKVPWEIPYHSESKNIVKIRQYTFYESQRIIGGTLHRVICRIGQEGLEIWNDSKIMASEPQLRLLLLQSGLRKTDLVAAMPKIITTLKNFLNDPRGRWILSNEHQDSQFEYSVTAYLHGQIHQIILDRTFIDNQGVRWIIDYKTTTHVDAEIKNSLPSYQNQLDRYASFFQLYQPKKIKLGLYFLLSGLWHEWTFIPDA